jgi:cell division transport system ATP-binding protein
MPSSTIAMTDSRVDAPTPVIAFDHVGLRYGVGPEVLRDLTFEFLPGTFFFLTGRSGAGKSSLLSLLYLARKPTRGTITIFGEDVQRAPRDMLARLRRRIGVVFQDFRLFEHLSVIENVALPLRIAGQDPEEGRRNIIELLQWVGLGDLLDAKPSTLSGGQQQLVAIARAVVARPQLLLADEPTGNVDDKLALRLLYLFEALHRMGTTVIIATHNLSLVRRFAYPELRLDGGSLTRLAPRAARQR